ncbi:Gfo/Idh/MocA family oxidoreductase [Paenibacillus filicis]|uniref:Gfo/Idh/MocA family oxidoreductase n=1 Tax=Paenibacillus gyeongsangnamensis TaxID=3388067 RepID=A0ABT4QKJ1_9BACL|nr:Gfo/Idh/MocA family oxidoreductase [Paenibacillus filicis]MCZ8517377.1 Gfo/Idh/MocA family oxidoreductase [Paenibacillus filicis]
MQKAAVVGLNNIGRIHCRSYKEHPDAELTAVCDLNRELADQAARMFGVKAYYDVNSMLEQEAIDIISIATGGVENGSHHYAPAMAAIEAGKSVLVEKPLSNDLAEAREMVVFARERGVRLGCNLNHRFTPMALKAKDWIHAGDLGDLLFVNMKLTIGNAKESSPWLHMRALHPHSFDVLRYFAGDVKRVQAFMTKAPGRTMWSTASINLEFKSGAVGHLMGSYDMDNRHPIEACEVAGHRGRFVLDNVYESLTYYPHGQEELRVYRNPVLGGFPGFDATFRSRLDTFIKQVEAQVPPDQIEASGADGLAVQELIEAAIQSQLSGGKVIDLS